MNDKQITIAHGKTNKVVTERDMRNLQKWIYNRWMLSRDDKKLLDAILSYFCTNVLDEAEVKC